MGIPKLPAAVTVFRNPCEEPGLLHTAPLGAYLDLVVRGGYHGQIRRERIYSQIVAPSQIDLFDGARKLLNGRRGSSAVRKSQTTLRGHEEFRTIREVPAPCCRALLGDVVSHRLSEGSHTLVDGRGTRRGHRFRLAGINVETAPSGCDRCQEKGTRPNMHR
jgi:hypothetical protein